MKALTDFAEEGCLTQTIDGFTARPAQQQMAAMIWQAIFQLQKVVIEAGTGTGKTYAYLVPALRASQQQAKKVIISTASKTLQDQLYHRDLPKIVQALNYTGKIALLKGRNNYLCLARFKQQQQALDLVTDHLADLALVAQWRQKSEDGDISHCQSVAEGSTIWPAITSTNDNCLGSDCPDYQDCFVVKARKQALDADVVVINHHLFFADSQVKATGFAELIPQTDLVVFDEAHQLATIASHYFSRQLTSRQLLLIVQDMLALYRSQCRDVTQLQKSAEQLLQRVEQLQVLLAEGGNKGDLRPLLTRQHAMNDYSVAKGITRLQDSLLFCREVLLALGQREQLITHLAERIQVNLDLLTQLQKFEQKGKYSYWYECFSRHFSLAMTPLSVAEPFSQLLKPQTAWVFTSATLAIKDDLQHFAQRLGINSDQLAVLASPFDYQQQALLYVPRYLPLANQADAAQRLTEQLLPIIQTNQGRCFLLCTSYQMMQALAEQFRQRLELPVLMQGERSKNELLQQYLTLGNALLVATASFWEGVDVPGDALSCVIIDKLPFASPDEPLLKARIDDCREQGKDPFSEIQLPEAVITLKQGVGRLIRKSSDRGVIVICDQRLVGRPYGEVFLASLPDARRTRCLAQVITFLQE